VILGIKSNKRSFTFWTYAAVTRFSCC